MTRWTTLVLCAGVMSASVLAGLPINVPMTSAEEQSVDLNAPEVMKHQLEQQIGKRVKVRLEGGQDLEGKVAKVGTHGVQLTDLTGMELFDATVKLEEISAVIVRVRTK